VCMSKPNIPPPPPPPQELKQPDSMGTRRAARKPGMGGSLLTGPAGVTGGMNTGGTSLLGG
jgi:hypothetical protein